jgi:hypothetical protein
LRGELEAQEKPRKEGSPYEPLFSRQTDREIGIMLHVFGGYGRLGWMDAVVRLLVDKGQGQTKSQKNVCESDPPTACFMTKVLSTTPPAGFWFQPQGTKPIEQPQKVLSTTPPAGLVSTGGTKPIEQPQKVLSNKHSGQFAFNRRNY